MANRLLNIDGLSLNFPGYLGNVHAVNGVSMHIDEGEIVGVVGESGSAKSVTAMTALQLLPKNRVALGQCGNDFSRAANGTQPHQENRQTDFTSAENSHEHAWARGV